jgi:hypothetical protein
MVQGTRGNASPFKQRHRDSHGSCVVAKLVRDQYSPEVLIVISAKSDLIHSETISLVAHYSNPRTSNGRAWMGECMEQVGNVTANALTVGYPIFSELIQYSHTRATHSTVEHVKIWICGLVAVAFKVTQCDSFAELFVFDTRLSNDGLHDVGSRRAAPKECAESTLKHNRNLNNFEGRAWPSLQATFSNLLFYLVP